MSVISNIPSPGVPMVGADGRLAPVWFQFFLTLFTRTGGTMGQDATAAQTELEQGNPQPDLAPLYGLILAVESLAAHAQAAANQKVDERGETGDTASIAQLSARLSELEARISEGSPLFTGLSQLANDAGFLAVASTALTSPAAGAAGPLPSTPAGYASVTIGAASHQIPYY